MVSHTIEDIVYGVHKLNEPLLIDLLKSPTVSRLRGVHQGGASYLVRPGRDGSRYDHSVGVMLLIRILGGSLAEQAAGLVHDLSHTAFSHVSDQVFNHRGEDFHEHHFHRLVLNSDIPDILAHHGLDIDEILNVSQWSLLEQPSPNLCADRIDYTLRDLLQIGYIDKTEIVDFVNSLIVYDKRIIVSDQRFAIWFAKAYATEVYDLFMNPLEIYANHQMAKIISKALYKNILEANDLFLQDEDVMRKIYLSGDPEIEEYMKTLHKSIEVIENKNDFDFQGFPKGRIVDPLVLSTNNQLVRCSVLEPSILKVHDKILQRAQEGVFVKAVT